MRTLKENLLRNVGVGRTRLIEEWLSKYVMINKGEYEIKDDYTIDVQCDYLTIKGDDLTEFPDYIQFGVVSGSTRLVCQNLTTLRGCPRKTQQFICNHCDKIVDLEGGPEEADYYSCSYCSNLRSLKGSPIRISNMFECSHCSKLRSLQYGPKHMDQGLFICNHTPIISLQYSPDVVRNIECLYTNITSLEGCPKTIYGDLNCSNCSKLVSLKGAPLKIGSFHCTYCPKLKSLDDCPYVYEYIEVEHCGKKFSKAEVQSHKITNI